MLQLLEVVVTVAITSSIVAGISASLTISSTENCPAELSFAISTSLMYCGGEGVMEVRCTWLDISSG